MTKIRKNLSDADMLAMSSDGNAGGEPQVQIQRDRKAEREQHQDYLTATEVDQLHHSLLELKLALYRQGIVDYKLKISCADNQVILKPVPIKAAKPKPR